MNAGLRIEWPV